MKARTFAHKPTVEILKFAPWQHHVAQVNPFYVSERKEEADVANAAGVIFFWADAWRDYWVNSKPIHSGRTVIAEGMNQSC